MREGRGRGARGVRVTIYLQQMVICNIVGVQKHLFADIRILYTSNLKKLLGRTFALSTLAREIRKCLKNELGSPIISPRLLQYATNSTHHTSRNSVPMIFSLIAPFVPAIK